MLPYIKKLIKDIENGIFIGSSIYTKRCKWCKKEYMTDSHSQIYCSSECGYTAKSKLKQV
jgi:hypothetical protein